MRLTPLTSFIILLAVPVFVYAWLMNSVIAVAAGFVILAFVLIRGMIFLRDLKAYTASFKASRTVDATILTQGEHVKVHVEASGKKTALSVALEDVPPAGTVVVQGSTKLTFGHADYVLRVPVIGTSVFGGLKISASDLFFTTTMPVAYVSAPELKVYAAGIATTFTQEGYSPVDDANERDRFALIAGTETRYFRPYADGDNVADINWKMSARYDELYVQLRTDAAGVNPVLIFDVPENGAEADTVSKFADAVSGTFDRLARKDAFPVIAYSGADCLWIGNSKHEEEIYAYLSLAGKVHRETQLFRHRHVSSILKEAANISPKNDFSLRIKEALSMSNTRYPTEFEQNMKHITNDTSISASANTHTHEFTGLYVITSALGDISNLLYMISDAAVFQRDVIFILAGIRGTERERYVISSLYAAGAATVEVVS